MIDKFIKTVTIGMIKAKEKSFFGKLLDKNNAEVAASNFFIISLLGIGLILLAVPIFILIVEAWTNHTISTDLNGMASYIMAVAAIFTSAGITKIGIHYTDNKFPESDPNQPSACEEDTAPQTTEIEKEQEGYINYGAKKRKRSKGD